MLGGATICLDKGHCHMAEEGQEADTRAEDTSMKETSSCTYCHSRRRDSNLHQFCGESFKGSSRDGKEFGDI